METDRPGPILCFGEVVLRLAAPTGMRLANAQSLAVHVGGSEANAGAVLAQLGHQTEMITVLSRSALGDQCEGELRRVLHRHVQCAARRWPARPVLCRGRRIAQRTHPLRPRGFGFYGACRYFRLASADAKRGLVPCVGDQPGPRRETLFDATLHAMRAMASAGRLPSRSM